MITTFAIGCFTVAGLLGSYRLLAGPGLADRIVALDVTLISLMGAITVDAAASGDTTNLIMLVVLAIIGFTATVSASRFLEHENPTSLAAIKAASTHSSSSKASRRESKS